MGEKRDQRRLSPLGRKAIWMRILLLGANGQVGKELRRSLSGMGEVHACTRQHANLEDLGALKAMIETVRPHVLVNAAAYTAVDQAEEEEERAYLVNHGAVALMADEMAARRGWLIHYSTDYVFDGTQSRPYAETDAPNPVNVYGASKLAGEQSIRASGGPHLILRTSWVYARHGRNFPNTIIELARQRDDLHVVADQIGAPTSASMIADVTALCVDRVMQSPDALSDLSGTYHLAPLGEVSWHGFAHFLVSEAANAGIAMRAHPQHIHAMTTADHARPAARPPSSRLCVGKIRKRFDLDLPHWTVHARQYIQDLKWEG